jgi:hypothetical protein
MHVVRDIGKADDAQLTAIREDATHLLDQYEQFMGGDLVEALCVWREAAKRQQERTAPSATVQPLRAMQAT